MNKQKGVRFLPVILSVLLLFVMTIMTNDARSEIPETINYQGYLTDLEGNPVSGLISMQFSLYADLLGGTAFWSEIQSVNVSNGSYSVIIGSVNTTLGTLAFDVPYYLGVKVESDAEMIPRTSLTSVGYAFTSATALRVAPGVVNSMMIEDGSVSSEDLNFNYADSTSKGGPASDLNCSGCVSQESIADNAVNSAKIANGTILFNDLSSNLCTSNQIMKWNGSAWTCAQDSGITSETDPKVGTLINGKWCTSNGTMINCTADAPALSTHSHDPVYVNVTGDTMTGSLRLPENGLVAGTNQIVLSDSNVGIGLTNPNRKLYIAENVSGVSYPLKIDNPHSTFNADATGILFAVGGDGGNNLNTFRGKGALVYQYTNTWNRGSFHFLQEISPDQTNPTLTNSVMTIRNSGNVGIGTVNPDQKFHVLGSGWVQGRFQSTDSSGGIQLAAYNTTLKPIQPRSLYELQALSDGGFLIHDRNHERNVMKVDNTGNVKFENGVVSVRVLDITGGADLSENFDINSADSSALPFPGMVVSIDSDNPGNLVISKNPYDKKVAGIISGAGGINPGMLMSQKKSGADGAYPIALSGRVYVWANTLNGQIQPGDLLTTSDMPGYAMRVSNYTQSQGATIGKAMSSLTEGKGLVLVLVSLQ